MGETTGIAWTDHTFNPWWGCTRVSEGCRNCYAEAFDKRVGGDHWGPGKERRTFGDAHWREPVKWNAAAEKRGGPMLVFCASMADVFDEEAPLSEWARLWRMIEATPFLRWQLLTKRIDRPGLGVILGDLAKTHPNVWLGTTVEDRRALHRIDALKKLSARVRFLSCEPLLEDLGTLDLTGIHWVIVGGESGPRRRPMRVEWLESIVEQCRAQGVAVFVKQDSGMKPGQQGRIPDSLWLKEFPDGYWGDESEATGGRSRMTPKLTTAERLEARRRQSREAQKRYRAAHPDRVRKEKASWRKRHPLYNIWLGMMSRCHNPRAPRFQTYGARGITVCDRWRSFARFEADITNLVGPRPSLEHSLDRIDNDRGYSPGNVRWATQATQTRNGRHNRRLSAFGETRLLVEWSEVTGVHRATLWSRLRAGWGLERALSEPARRMKPRGR